MAIVVTIVAHASLGGCLEIGCASEAPGAGTAFSRLQMLLRTLWMTPMFDMEAYRSSALARRCNVTLFSKRINIADHFR